MLSNLKKKKFHQLIPVLRKNALKENTNMTENLLRGCKRDLEHFFPLQPHVREFISLLFDYGKIDASLLTQKKDLKEKIESHPLLKWRAQLVLKNKR